MIPDAVDVWAQHLEAVSTECARAFRAVVPQIVPILQATAFDRWAEQGLALAQASWRGWECAVWYFRLSPQLLTRLDPATLAGLTAPTIRAMQVSPQLGTELLRGAARFVEGDRQARLSDWINAGEHLAPVGRGGRLAEAYFEVSPEVLSLTGLSEFQEWTELVHTLGQTAEATALEFVRQSPQRLEKMPPLARLKGLRVAHTLGRRAPATAADLLKTLPGLLHVVSGALRDRLLDLALHVAEVAPQHLDRLLKAMTRLMQGLPEMDQELLLGQCLRATLVDAEAGTLLCEHLPTVLGQLVAKDVDAWVTRGLVVLRDNREGGLAYFALESQASQTALAALGRIAYLQHVQGVLRLYASALAGQSLSIRPLAELPPAFRSGLRQFPTTDGETIYLPESADRFASRELNFQMFLVMTAHQAGYLEFATFSFGLDTLADRLVAEAGVRHLETWRASPSPPAAARSDFERFFAGFPRPSVARDIFYCLEDGRVDYLLRQTYRGLAPHIERLIRDGLASRPPLTGRPLWGAALEVLLHLCCVGRVSLKLPPMLVPLARFLRGVVERVRKPQATVCDAAIATVEVYGVIEQLPNVRVAALDGAYVDGEVVTLAEVLSRDDAVEAFRDLMPSIPAGEEVAYQSPDPLPHQGEFKPDLIQHKLKVKELSDQLEQLAKTTQPISPELLRQLLEQGVDIDIRGTVAQQQDETSGFFVSDLEDKAIAERAKPRHVQPYADHQRIREQLSEELKRLDGGEVVYRYDEWDYLMRDYRAQWCLLREKAVEGAEAGFVAGVLQENAALISQIRKQFQLLKPEMFKKLKRREHGEDIDFDAAIEGFVDRRVTGVASERVYIKRNKREREVSTIFLLDLSASTDDPIEHAAPMAVPAVTRHTPRQPRSDSSGLGKDDGFYAPLFAADHQKPRAKRIIDVEKEALVVMAEALESIGDEYAIYGFSGYGRDNVEFFVVKDVEERYSEAVKRRIDVLKPYRSTRMGPAIRHASQKLYRRPARLKTLILLSDGYPQDFDYGKDRRGKDYGIQDTKVALQEARRKRIHTFCITVDREGKSYLPEMCGEEKFMVIENVAHLPQLLPKVYRGLTT
ncbi:MAG TPA: VWA domain-containing protein [Candidatus Tectomicrobia bacterium]|nr:VWA domain-containing protein [Candidatus Tectomicrobia bacterium]